MNTRTPDKGRNEEGSERKRTGRERKRTISKERDVDLE